MLVNPSNEMKEVFRRIYNKENLSGVATVFGTSGFSSGCQCYKALFFVTDAETK